MDSIISQDLHSSMVIVKKTCLFIGKTSRGLDISDKIMTPPKLTVEFVHKNCSTSSVHSEWTVWKVQFVHKNCSTSWVHSERTVWIIQLVHKNCSTSSVHCELNWTVEKVQLAQKELFEQFFRSFELSSELELVHP